MLLFLWMATACAERPVATAVRGEDVGAEACEDVEIDPTDVDFGEVEVGDEDYVRVTLTNEGEEPLEVLGVDVDQDRAFSVSAISSILIQPGASAELTVTFAPEEVGVVEIDVVFQTNLCGDDLAVHVTGEGVEAR